MESLLAQDDRKRVDLSILVVDNGCGSTPPIPDVPSVELIRVSENRGFSGGHNIVVRRAIADGADYVFLLNSDAVAEPTCIREMVAAAEMAPAAAFLGPVVVSAADTGSIESAGQSFSLLTARHRELARGHPVSSVGDRALQVDAVSGCALLARISAVEAIGLLDERLFIYFEDMDWCLRARRAGYEVLVAPRAHVVHIGQGSVGSASPLTTFYSVRNHMLVAARYAGRIRGRLLEILVLGYHLAFIARSRPRRNVTHLGAVARGAWSAWTGRLGAYA